MGKRKEEVWNRKKYPLLFVAFVFIRAELLLNARRILFFSRVSGKRSFVEFRARFPSRRQYARLTLASINQPVERISTIRRRDANDRRYSSGIRRSRVVDGTTFYIFSYTKGRISQHSIEEDGGNLTFLPRVFAEAKEAKEKLDEIAIFPEKIGYVGAWLGRERTGAKYRLSEERRVDGRQASKCSHRSQSPKCLHHRDGIRLLSAVSGRLEFVRESFE